MKFNQWNESKNVVILDTETTGLYEAEIVEIAVIDTSGNVLLNTLVKPKNGIPEEVTAIHGITNEMVAGAPTWPEVWEQLYSILNGKKVLIYNSDFDIRLMKESFYPWEDELGWERVDKLIELIDELDTDCVMKIYATLINAPKWLKLREAAGRETAHRALDDCMATLEVVKKAYKPEFTELDYHRIGLYEEYQYIEGALERITEELMELADRQRKLLRDRQKCLAALLDDQQLQEYIKTKKEVAAADPFADDDLISDEDNLPF